ncbi:MAG: dTDP-4-dehydrorhamnose 3,5-epimerase family protein [Rhodothermales bacterium]|nr:dTDP-4-dehydrorhamnose 3,5-epimerase family protein [Rhodothermales bacterium]MBO6779729.1 dTDP-4-dehydrorhamnose 3,5-epimerase family protein [Rhodothermales bacterium]
MTWTDGIIADCPVAPLRPFSDDRGWLSEIFRTDEAVDGHVPVMAYISETLPGVARGPHAHEHQADLFAFFDGRFRVYLWDSREGSDSYGVRQVFEAGREFMCTVRIPPGVVHAYRCLSDQPALILNCPDRLYAGDGKNHPVDEIRYEDMADSPYTMD